VYICSLHMCEIWWVIFFYLKFESLTDLTNTLIYMKYSG